jgi:hypothetical protein
LLVAALLNGPILLRLALYGGRIRIFSALSVNDNHCRQNCRNLAIFTAIRRASSCLSNFAADLRLICYLATLEGAAAMHNKKILMKLTDRFWHYFFLNPVAWFLLLLLIVAVYANYKLNRQLDTVCDWIKSPDEFIDRPNNAYARAQNICKDRHEWPIAS